MHNPEQLDLGADQPDVPDVPDVPDASFAPGADEAVVRRTQVFDVIRAVPLGVQLTMQTSVLLTILVKRFDAPTWTKGLIAAAGGVGMLSTPFVIAVARRLQLRAMTIASTIACATAAATACALGGTLWMYLAGAMVAALLFDSTVPLMTTTLQRNFPGAELGRRVGAGMTVKVLASIGAAWTFGTLLDRGIGNWRIVIMIGVAAGLLNAWCSRSIPSEPISRVPGMRNRPWPHFHLLAVDRQLRLTLIAWMFMGFGNLMLLPMRVEYLNNPRYGIEASAGRIVMLTATIPSICRFITMPLFGWIFDRMSFFASRIAVNGLFALYVAAFFTGDSGTSLLIGAIMLGIASAGGDLMWSLWVTKFAPQDRVADYMGLHTFFTGVRACIAPLLAFALVERVSLATIAWIAAAMIVVSGIILAPEARAERARRRTAATHQP